KRDWRSDVCSFDWHGSLATVKARISEGGDSRFIPFSPDPDTSEGASRLSPPCTPSEPTPANGWPPRQVQKQSACVGSRGTPPFGFMPAKWGAGSTLIWVSSGAGR